MRLFLALAPPAAAVADLDAVVAPLRAEAPHLRWQQPAGWHLTVCFLGEVGDDRRDRLHEAVGPVLLGRGPLGLAFTGAGRFGGRVLWTGLRGDLDSLGHLAAGLAEAARGAGIAVEDRPYRPHLTLARSSWPTDLRSLVARLAGYAGPPWQADALLLVRSLPGGPARYETQARWPLSSDPAERRRARP